MRWTNIFIWFVLSFIYIYKILLQVRCNFITQERANRLSPTFKSTFIYFGNRNRSMRWWVMILYVDIAFPHIKCIWGAKTTNITDSDICLTDVWDRYLPDAEKGFIWNRHLLVSQTDRYRHLSVCCLKQPETFFFLSFLSYTYKILLQVRCNT